MAVAYYPPIGKGSSSGGGGGSATVTFPLLAPPGSPPSYGFTSGGGLGGTSDGGLALVTSQASQALKLDPSGAATFSGALTSQGVATLSGGTTTTTLTAQSATISANASIGGSLGIAGSAQVTGDISARKVTATSDLSAASLSTTGPIAGATLNLSGKATLGSLEVKGTFKADSIQSDGPLYFPTASTNLPGLALGDEHGTGLFAAQGGTIGLSSNGQVVVSFSQALAATFAGSITAQALTAQATTLASLTVTGATVLANAQLAQLNASGAAVLASDLTVQGTTRLANLAIDHISTDNDLTVGRNALVKGTLQVQGATSLAALTVQGNAALAGFTGQLGIVTGLRVAGGSSGNPPVERDPIPNSSSTTDYVFVLTSDGALSMSNNLYVGGTSSLHGAVSLDAGLTGQAAQFTQLTTSGVATIGGAISTPSSLTAQSTAIGGSSFATVHGSPNGALTASTGAQAIDLDSGTLYLKLSGSNTNSGWVAVTTQATASSFPLLAGNSPDSNHPQFAYSADSRSGFGRLASGTLFISQAGNLALQLDSSGNASLGYALAVAGPASLSGTLSVTGATTLAALTAQATQVSTLTAGQTTLGATTAASASVSGALSAGATTLASLQVSGDSQLGGALTVTGPASSGASLVAPVLGIGSVRLRSGTGNPNGAQTGNVGDEWVQTDTGDYWIKVSGTGNQGWVKVSTSATGVTYPLTAPDGTPASPSLGFAQGGLGLTADGTQQLVAVTNSTVGWRLDANQNFSLVAGLTVAGGSSLQAVTAAGISASSLALSAGLTVGGNSTLQALTATAAQVTSLAASSWVTAASVSTTGAITAGGAVAGATVVSGTSTWRSLSAVPANTVGADGDITSLTQGSYPLAVRLAGSWRQVALTGDPAPAQFPLRGPADSASAPNFAPSAASSGSGMFSPGSNQLGFSTNGTSAATVDAAQKWTFAAGIAAGPATFSQATINGTLSATGNASLGGTLQVNQAVTLSSTLSSGAITSSGQVSGSSLSAAGAVSGQSLSISADGAIGGNLTVSGTVVYNGLQKTGNLQVSDGSSSAPSIAFTSETGLGIYRPSSGVLGFAVAGAPSLTLAAAIATVPGAIRVGGTNAGLTSPGANQLALQTAGNPALTIAASGVASFAFQSQHVAGTVSAPGLAVGAAGTGFFTLTDAQSRSALAVAVGGQPVGRFVTFTANSLPVYGLGLGDPASTTTSGALVASAQLPSTGAPNAMPSAVYAYLGGGAAQSLWVNESTTSTPNFVKVLTTSSPAPSPTYPLVGPAGTAAAPTFQAASGNGLYSTASATGLAYNGTQAALFSASLLTLPGSVQVGGTNAGLISPGTNQVAIQTAGNTALSFAASGVGTFGFQVIATAGTAAAPGLAIGSSTTGLAAINDASANPTISTTVAGKPNAIFKTTLGNTLPIYTIGLGDPASSTVNGGLAATAQSPVNNISGFPSQLVQDTRGGAGCLYVNEGTAPGSANWVKVLTASSSQTISYPLQSTTIGTATAPAYGFSVSGYTTTGFLAVNDVADGNLPSAAVTAGGVVAGFFNTNTVNSIPVYNLIFGNPANNASPYNAVVRSSAQAFSGNVTAAPGQLGINPAGGAGTVLAVKETGVGTNTGWNFVYTQGTTQLAGASGTAAAPVYSFSADKTSGFYLGDVPYVSASGKQVAGFLANVAGKGYPGLVFGANNTQGVPYILSVNSGAANAGNPNTNAVGGYQAALMLNGAGAAGDQLWIHEASSGTSGWARVLTESTNINPLNLLQGAAPGTYVSGVAKVWADTSNQLRVGIFGVNASSAPIIRQDIQATAYGGSQTLIKDNSGSQIYVSTAQTHTLPASAAVDLVYRWQVEAAVTLTIKANSGQTIAVGNTVSAAAGTTATSSTGSFIELFLRSGGTMWIARSVTGSWTTT